VNVAIFSRKKDTQSRHVAAMLRQRGADVTWIEGDAFDRGIGHSLRNQRFFYDGTPMEDLRGVWVRQVRAPLAPWIEKDDRLLLHDDWFVLYMRQREQHAFVWSWLLSLAEEGKNVINPPSPGTIGRLKPYQLYLLHRKGLPVPASLVTNDPGEVRRFRDQVGEVVFKPSMGGAFCERLTPEKEADLAHILHAPVIFQEWIRGIDIRVMVLDGHILSSVVVEVPPETLDFRTDDNYSTGQGTYREHPLPRKVEKICARAARLLRLRFAGIDLKMDDAGNYHLLECNSSPVYLDVERKMGHPITARLVDALLSET